MRRKAGDICLHWRYQPLCGSVTLVHKYGPICGTPKEDSAIKDMIAGTVRIQYEQIVIYANAFLEGDAVGCAAERPH